MMKYRAGFKYQLAETEIFETGIKGFDVDTDFIKLTESGSLYVLNGYAWDGASGPTIDTKSSMRGSLAHDALYQLMRMGLLPQAYRKKADILLRDICLADGMFIFRAWSWYYVVSMFAKSNAQPKSKREILQAP